MNRMTILLALAVAVSSCSPAKKTTSTSTAQTAESANLSSSAQDGSSFEKAIIIQEKSEGAGVNAEYKWLAKNYPGYKMISQSLGHNGKKQYDILNIKTKDGEDKVVYFDISNFFGKL